MAHGEINHIEFPTDDPGRAKAFYGAVAGPEFGERDGGSDVGLFQSSRAG